MRLKQGHIIRVDFSPTIGSEQKGVRPAVVISNDFVLSKTNIILVSPITTKQGATALNIAFDERTKTQGAVLCAHTRALDLSKRPYSIVEELPEDKLQEVLDTVACLIEPSK